MGECNIRRRKSESSASVLTTSAALRAGEKAHDLPKVLRVRTKTGRHAGGGGFDHVLTAPTTEAAADETDVCHRPPGRQFANDVDEDDLRTRPFARVTDLRPTHERER